METPPAPLPKPDELTLDETGYVLEMAEMVELWIGAVKARAKALADRGVPIPGFKLVDKRGRRVWANEDDAERIVGALTPLVFYTKFHSPTQVEKILKTQKIKKPDQWNELVTMSDPGTALVPASDPRAAVQPRIEFEIVNQEEQ